MRMVRGDVIISVRVDIRVHVDKQPPVGMQPPTQTLATSISPQKPELPYCWLRGYKNPYVAHL